MNSDTNIIKLQINLCNSYPLFYLSELLIIMNTFIFCHFTIFANQLNERILLIEHFISKNCKSSINAILVAIRIN